MTVPQVRSYGPSNPSRTAVIEEWMVERRDKGASASTVNNEFALLSNMFTKAKQWGDVTHDPTKGIEKFKTLSVESDLSHPRNFGV
jgi:hypothetical protein